MTRNLFKLLYITIFTLYSLAVFPSKKTATPSYALNKENYILIFSSYQYNNPWATSIAKKIQQQLEKDNPEFIFRIVYASLDIQKNMLASRLNMQKAFSQAWLTPTILVPRVLVLIGDESWMLYRIMNLRGKWEKTPVVLCGVHDKILKDYSTFFTDSSTGSSFADSLMFPIAESKGQLNVTGVLRDNVSYKQSVFMHTISPGLKEVVYISRGNYSDEYIWNQESETFLTSHPDIKLTYFNRREVSGDSICNYINRLSPDSAAVLFNSHPPFLSSLNLPTYSSSDEGEYNNSITGGYYTATDQLAQQTAKLVMRIYEGTSISQLPFQYVQGHHYCLNEQAPYLPDSHWQKEELEGLTYYNRPPVFIIRHLRAISLIMLTISICIAGSMIYIRTKKYQKHIQALFKKYKELHEKFQIVYDNMPIALSIFNEEGRLLHQNSAVKRLQYSWHLNMDKELNLFEDFIVQKQLQERIRHKENINQILPIQNGTFQSRPSEVYETAYDYFRLMIRHIPDANNNTDNILVMLIDNSDIYREKIATRRVRNLFNFAINKAAIGVSEYNLYSTTGQATDIWRKHLALQGNPSFPAVFQNVEEKDRKEILEFYEQAYQRGDQYFNKEIKVIHGDGSPHYLREQIKVVQYQPEQGEIWVVELNQNIDEEKIYTAEIQAAIEKTRETSRLKNTFIANMSNEIRTPLNAIVGFSDLITTIEDIEVRQEMICHIEENNAILLRQINDIIELSKMESGTMTFTLSETNINELFHDSITNNQFKANQKNLTLQCECEMNQLFIETDQIRFSQVIAHLLSNAIKYTDEGYIRLGYRLEKNTLYTYVTDTGIGISQEFLPQIFDRFFRINKDSDGHGIGLAIARTIIEGLNGEIGVDSEVGKGSTFWFRLPVKVIQIQKISSPRVMDGDGRIIPGQLPRILVVEDDESYFLLIQFMLKNAVDIIRAPNTKEAIKLFREKPQDLVLIDVKQPNKNGYRECWDFRAISSHTPIIATTAFVPSTDEAKALANDFNASLAKPLEKQALLDTINHWLNNTN